VYLIEYSVNVFHVNKHLTVKTVTKMDAYLVMMEELRYKANALML